jgi:hypothetical protein
MSRPGESTSTMADLLLLHIGGAAGENPAAMRQAETGEAMQVFLRGFPGRAAGWRRPGELLIAGQPAAPENGAAVRAADPSVLALSSWLRRAGGDEAHSQTTLRWSEATEHRRAGQPCAGPAPCLFLVTSCVPPSEADEFDAWYDGEHAPLLLRIPGWRTVERYRVDRSTDEVTHVALHYIDDPALLEHPERAAAGRTGWTLRLARRPWFGRNTRHVYQAADLKA